MKVGGSPRRNPKGKNYDIFVNNVEHETLVPDPAPVFVLAEHRVSPRNSKKSAKQPFKVIYQIQKVLKQKVPLDWDSSTQAGER